MIIVLDTARGQKHDFKFRKDAAEFIGVSLPVLRTWLKEPFFLYRTLIITHTTNGTQKKTIPVQGFQNQEPVFSIDHSRPEGTSKVDRAG